MQGKHWLLMVLSTIIFVLFGYIAINVLTSSNDTPETADVNTSEDVSSETNTTLDNDVEEITRDNDDTVIVIDDEEFNQDDIDFIKYLQLAQIDYFEEEAGENWNEARRTQTANNTQIQNLIELHIMESLGNEKGYEFTDEDIEEAKDDFNSQFSDTENYTNAQELAGDDFDDKFTTFIVQRMTIDAIIDDLRAMAEQEFPNTREEDIIYEAGKEYQLLLADQRDDHQIKVFNDFDE